jgi:hypothetical protein
MPGRDRLLSRTSDQSWLGLSAASGTAPSTLQVSPSITGLKAGTYTGHVTLTGGGTTKSIAVAISGGSYRPNGKRNWRGEHTDQTVQSGTKYYYVVTAVDDQGRESAYSDQVALTIP